MTTSSSGTEIEFELEERDLKALTAIELELHPERVLSPDPLRDFILFGLLLIGLNMTRQQETILNWLGGGPAGEVTYSIVVGLCIGPGFMAFSFAIYRWFKQPRGDRRSSFVRESQRVRVSSEGLVVQTETFEGLYRWQGITRIHRSHGHAFFWSKRRTIVVPRRAFVDTDGYQEFVDLAITYREKEVAGQPVV